MQRGAPDQSRRPKVQTFTGTIARTREMKVKGADVKHEVAVLQSGQQDRRLLVDFGPADKLEQLNLQEGDKVRVQGIAMNISGRRVLVADQVSKNGKSLDIDRQALPTNLPKAGHKSGTSG